MLRNILHVCSSPASFHLLQRDWSRNFSVWIALHLNLILFSINVTHQSSDTEITLCTHQTAYCTLSVPGRCDMRRLYFRLMSAVCLLQFQKQQVSSFKHQSRLNSLQPIREVLLSGGRQLTSVDIKLLLKELDTCFIYGDFLNDTGTEINLIFDSF